MSVNARLASDSSGERYEGTSRDGYTFDVRTSHWRLNKDVVISLGMAAELPEPTQTGFREALRRYAEDYSARHAENMASRFNRYLRDTHAQDVSVEGLLNWRVVLGDQNQWHLGALKGFLLAWRRYGFPGVSYEVADLLNGWRLKGNDKGTAVITSDPETGSLTDVEVHGLLDWANAALSRREIAFSNYAYFMTLLMTARRPVQIAALRGKDLTVQREDGAPLFRLNVPRTKQRGEGFRQSFRSLAIIDDLHTILCHQHLFSVALIEKRVGAIVPESLKAEIPIFVNEKCLKNVVDLSSLQALLFGSKPDSVHATTSWLSRALRQFASLCTAKSERTGEPIRLFATRFRYTRGTKLRREGFSEFVIAELLDHSDVQNVRVYTQNTAQEAVVINKQIGAKLAPFAQACLGTLVKSEREAIRGGDPHSRVPNQLQHAIGTCGNYGFCASGFKACYTCRFFQPWVDGPHQEVLEELYAEKERAREAGCAEEVVNSDDRLILAVEDCVARCAAAKQQISVVAAG
jgi:integrase